MLRNLVSLFAVLILQSLFCCCSSDIDESTEISHPDLAPTDVIGKEFKFYKNDNLKFSFKAILGENSKDAIILTSSEVAITTSDCNAWYYKTGAQTGKFECYFTTMILLGHEGMYQWNQYKFILNFLSQNHGYFTGIKMKNPMDNKGEEISGRFIFNSDKEPSDFNWNTSTDNINYEYLVGNTWFNKNNDCYRYIKFNKNCSFRQYISIHDEIEKTEGYYEIDKSANIVTLKSSINNNIYEQFKINKLTNNEMTVLLPDINGVFSEKFFIHYKKIKDEEAPSYISSDETFKVSEPIIESITDKTALVKGTIIGENVVFKSRGIQYSTDPNMKMDVKTIQHNANVINVQLNDLYVGTTYYVRLFAQTENKTDYSSVKSFTTKGTKVNSIKMIQKGIFNNVIVIDTELPNNVEEYGICFGKSPNPQITDAYRKEQNRCERWVLDGLNSATRYYIRPYHIEGSNVIYYDESEVAFETLGKSVKFDCELDLKGLVYNYQSWDAIIKNPGISVNWENFMSDTYLLNCSILSGKNNTLNFGHTIDTENGSTNFSSPGYLWFGLMYNINTAHIQSFVTDLNGNLITTLCLRYEFDKNKEEYSKMNRNDMERDIINKYLGEGKIGRVDIK